MNVTYFIIVFILLIFSGYFSAADMVYGIVDKEKLKAASKKSKAAKVALKLANNYEFSISSILFGNNLVNILASSLVAIIGLSINEVSGPSVAAFIFTIIVIIFAEFLPKAIAKRFNYSLAIIFAYPTTFFCYTFFIITWPLSKLFNLVTLLFKKKSKEEDKIDDKVLDEMIDEIVDTGELEDDEAEIIRGAVDLIDIEAYEIMTPRVDVFALDIDDPLEKILEEKDLLEYSRVPVYQDTIDNIIGILPMKILSRKLLAKEDINIKELMVKPMRIPRNYQVINLLDDFKRSLTHMAIVMDEYGGTEGIVTMEDVLEEIVGDIFDEQDEIKEEYVSPRKGVYIVDGGMNIDDFFELIDCHDKFDTNYSTVSGFCQVFLKDFAKAGDTFKFSHYRAKILEAKEYTAEIIQVRDLNKKKRV